MLWLKRNTRFNELMKCDISGDLIGPGDYYYIDDVDGVRIKATVYKELKDKEKEETWDYTKINAAQSEADYKRMLRDATRQMLGSTILERKVAGKYDPKPEVESEIIQDLYNSHNGGVNND